MPLEWERLTPYQGAFYAVGAGVGRWLATSRGVQQWLERLEAQPDDPLNQYEDLALGWALAHCPGNLSSAPLPHVAGVFSYELADEANLGRVWASNQGCFRRHNLTRANLTSGFNGGRVSSPTPEVVSPTAAVLHHVRTTEAWRRVWALTAHWTGRLAGWGHPACFYPELRVGDAFAFAGERPAGIRTLWHSKVPREYSRS